jgi:hypothetical protein
MTGTGIMRAAISSGSPASAVHPHVTIPAGVLASGRDASALAAGRPLEVSSPLIWWPVRG